MQRQLLHSVLFVQNSKHLAWLNPKSIHQLDDIIKIQASNISNDTTVTGIPTIACWEKVILMSKFEACSTTIRFAILPNKNKLPAKVLDAARVYHWEGLKGSRKRSSNIVAGTLLNKLLNIADIPVSTGRLCKSIPILASPFMTMFK